MTWLESFLPGLMAVKHIHPLVVHFPIALLLSALVTQLLGHFTRHHATLCASARWLLYSGTVLACITIITGYSAAGQLEHDTPGHELVHIHRNWMVVTTVAAIVVSWIAWMFRHNSSRLARLSVTGMLFFLCVTLAMGADRGALLVYRYGLGVTTTPREEIKMPDTSGIANHGSDREKPNHGHNSNDHQH